MNKLYCRFCKKELIIGSNNEGMYMLNLYCCKRQYMVERTCLTNSFNIIEVLFDLFMHDDIQYAAHYEYDNDITSFNLNNTNDFKKPNCPNHNYHFDGFVDQAEFKRRMKLKAFW